MKIRLSNIKNTFNVQYDGIGQYGSIYYVNMGIIHDDIY